MQVIWKKFYKTSSASDHGTLYQLRNLVQRRNVGKKPKKDFNAHDSFFSLVTTSHILAAAMELLGMDSLDDHPSEHLLPENVQALPKSERSMILNHICDVVLHSYVDLHHSVEVEDPVQRIARVQIPAKVKNVAPKAKKIPEWVKKILANVKRLPAKMRKNTAKEKEIPTKVIPNKMTVYKRILKRSRCVRPNICRIC